MNKSVISRLSAEEQTMVKGGIVMFTSSGKCTGFLCCDGTGTNNCPISAGPECCTNNAGGSCTP